MTDNNGDTTNPRQLRETQTESMPMMLTPSNLPKTPSVTTAYAFYASIYDVLIDKSNERKPVVYYILQLTGELVDSGAESIEWTVSRRYSSFVQLRSELTLVGFTNLPPLPPKTWFMDRLNPGLIEKRKNELTSFVNAMIRNKELFKTRLVRYFLKTSDFFKKRSASSIRRSNGYSGSRSSSIADDVERKEMDTNNENNNNYRRTSRLGQSVRLIPSPSALPARDPDDSREIYTTLRAVSFNHGNAIDVGWGNPVAYESTASKGNDTNNILSWMPQEIRLQMENEKVFLTIDPDTFSESDLLSPDGVWIKVNDNSVATTSLRGAKIKLIVQRERLRSFSNSRSNVSTISTVTTAEGLPYTFLLIIVPLLLSYLILFTSYNSNIVLLISFVVVLLSLYVQKDMLNATPKENNGIATANSNEKRDEVTRTLITFADCELSSAEAYRAAPTAGMSNNNNNNSNGEETSGVTPTLRGGEEKAQQPKEKIYVNHSGTWIVDENRSKTTYEPMLIALGISWPLRMLVRSLKTEMRVKHTLTHINRRDHFQNGGKPCAKDKDNHIFPLNGKTYFKRDEKNEDVYVTHTFEPDNGACIQSITINKTQNIKIIDRQRLIDNGRALHHTIETWGKDTPEDKPAICDVIKKRMTRPVEGNFDSNIGENSTLTYNAPEGWVLADDETDILT
jgi:hypothetical protein